MHFVVIILVGKGGGNFFIKVYFSLYLSQIVSLVKQSDVLYP